MAQQFRRVVTGHDPTGRAIVKIDEMAKTFVSPPGCDLLRCLDDRRFSRRQHR